MPWTNITSGTSWQDLAVARELAAQFNRRALVFGWDTMPEPTTADPVLEWVYDFWVRLSQAEVWEHAVDPSAAFTGLEDDDPYPSPYASFLYVYAAAGMPDGPRRARFGSPADWTDWEDPAYTFGPPEDGDVAGPWLYQDLQAALDALSVYLIEPTVEAKLASLLYEVAPPDPLPDYPTGAPSYGSWSQTINKPDVRLGFGDATSFTWVSEINQLRVKAPFDMGEGEHDTEYIGTRRRNDPESDEFWSIWGGEHTTTWVMATVSDSTDARDVETLQGAISSWSLCFPMLPEPVDGVRTIPPATVRVDRVIMLIKFPV